MATYRPAPRWDDIRKDKTFANEAEELRAYTSYKQAVESKQKSGEVDPAISSVNHIGFWKSKSGSLVPDQPAPLKSISLNFPSAPPDTTIQPVAKSIIGGSTPMPLPPFGPAPKPIGTQTQPTEPPVSTGPEQDPLPEIKLTKHVEPITFRSTDGNAAVTKILQETKDESGNYIKNKDGTYPIRIRMDNFLRDSFMWGAKGEVDEKIAAANWNVLSPETQAAIKLIYEPTQAPIWTKLWDSKIGPTSEGQQKLKTYQVNQILFNSPDVFPIYQQKILLAYKKGEEFPQITGRVFHAKNVEHLQKYFDNNPSIQARFLSFSNTMNSPEHHPMDINTFRAEAKIFESAIIYPAMNSEGSLVNALPGYGYGVLGTYGIPLNPTLYADKKKKIEQRINLNNIRGGHIETQRNTLNASGNYGAARNLSYTTAIYKWEQSVTDDVTDLDQRVKAKDAMLKQVVVSFQPINEEVIANGWDKDPVSRYENTVKEWYNTPEHIRTLLINGTNKEVFQIFNSVKTGFELKVKASPTITPELVQEYILFNNDETPEKALATLSRNKIKDGEQKANETDKYYERVFRNKNDSIPIEELEKSISWTKQKAKEYLTIKQNAQDTANTLGVLAPNLDQPNFIHNDFDSTDELQEQLDDRRATNIRNTLQLQGYSLVGTPADRIQTRVSLLDMYNKMPEYKRLLEEDSSLKHWKGFGSYLFDEEIINELRSVTVNGEKVFQKFLDAGGDTPALNKYYRILSRPENVWMLAFYEATRIGDKITPNVYKDVTKGIKSYKYQKNELGETPSSSIPESEFATIEAMPWMSQENLGKAINAIWKKTGIKFKYGG